MGSARTAPRRTLPTGGAGAEHTVRPQGPRPDREGAIPMSQDAVERAAMLRALELAASPDAPLWPNPRVGCVLLAPDGTTVAEGYHRGAGTPHAEVDALAAAGPAARGTTAVLPP